MPILVQLPRRIFREVHNSEFPFEGTFSCGRRTRIAHQVGEFF